MKSSISAVVQKNFHNLLVTYLAGPALYNAITTITTNRANYMNRSVLAPLGAILTMSSASFDSDVMSWRKDPTSPLVQASQRAACTSRRAFSFASTNTNQLVGFIASKVTQNKNKLAHLHISSSYREIITNIERLFWWKFYLFLFIHFKNVCIIKKNVAKYWFWCKFLWNQTLPVVAQPLGVADTKINNRLRCSDSA